MPLPPDVETCTVNVGTPFGLTGRTGFVHVVIRPLFGGTASRLIWTATGDPFESWSEQLPSANGGRAASVSLDIPYSDQPGFRDPAGNAVTMWPYQMTVTTFDPNGVQTGTTVKEFTPLTTGPAVLDFDLIISEGEAAPVTGGSPVVLFVNGHSGPSINLTKTDVGLPLVDNTPDSGKPASTPQRAAFAGINAFGVDVARPDLADLAAAAAAATTAGKALLVTPGSWAVANDLTITAPVVLYPGATIAPASGKTVTINAVVTAPAAQTVFGGAGTVILGKPQEVWADWWGGKGSAASGTTTIQRALRGTAQGTKILLAGKYWASARIDVVANSTTGLGDQGKSLIGAAGPGTRTETAGSEWGAEVYLANGVNDDLFKATGTLTGAGQPPRFAFTVDNIKFNGNKANNASGLAAFRLHAVKDFYIGRILCENANGKGFYCSSASNQIIAQHIEAMNNTGTGIDLASAGDSHIALLLAGANGAFGVQLGGGTQVTEIQSYSNTTAGVSFSGVLNAVSMLRANANGAEGVRFNGVTDNWVGVAYAYDNGTDTGTTATSRVGVRFDTGAARNKIGHLNTTSTSGTQQYGVRYGSALTGTDNLIDTYVGSGNAVGEVSNASARNRAAYVNGASVVDALTVVGSFVPPVPATLLTAASVNNTSTETILWTDATIAAADLAVGQVYRVQLHGDFDTKASGGLFTMKVKANGTNLKAFNAAGASQTSLATAVGWTADLEVYIEAVGAGGSVSVAGRATVITGASGTVGSIVVQGLAVSVDLSAGLTLTATGTMVTADPANTLRIKRASRAKVA